jgi:hypothetical protein
MRHVLRLSVAALLMLAPNAFSQTKPPAPPPKTAVAKRADSAQQPASDNALPTVSAAPAPEVKAKPNDPYDPKSDTLYRVNLVFTIIGVFVAFGGIGVLIWQTGLTRISANAARDAAVAAKIGSQANINSERPWLFIDFKVNPTEYDENGIPAHLGFSVSFKNHGNTPAEVVSFDQHPDCRESTDDLPMPPKYSMEGHVMVHTRMVPSGESWQDKGESFFFPEGFFMVDQWKDIQRSRKRFVYWGRIQYRDLIEEAKSIHSLKELGPVHETCFCYFWSPPLNQFLICGPWGYNKHT